MNEHVGIGASGNRVGVGEDVTLEIARAGIERFRQRGVVCGGDERRGGSKAVPLENLRHLGDGQSFGEGNGDGVHFPARDLPHHVPGRHRVIEPVFAGLQSPRIAARPERDPIGDLVANDPFGDQRVANRSRAGAARDVHELLGALVAAKRFIEALQRDVAERTSDNKQDE